MPVRVEVAPDLLHWAVERAGWDEETTDRRAPKLREWATGEVLPTLKQLEKFASDTYTPFGMLFLAKPPDERVPIPDMRTIRNAEISRPSADLLDTIYLCQTRQDWYRDYVLENGLVEPVFVGTASTDAPPARTAREIRSLLNFELDDRVQYASFEDARRGLIDRIEAIDVLVMVNGIVGTNTHRRLNPEEFRGFALTDRVAPLIFVNGADTKAAQIFTLIHELAHVWLGESALSDASLTAKKGADAELWCNAVAAEVLVPIDALRADYSGNPGEEELERLAKKYRVSTLVVLKRLFDANAITWDEYRQRYEKEQERLLRILGQKQADRLGGNFYYTHPLRLSHHFARAVIASAFEGSTTFRDAYYLLGLKNHATFENLAEHLKVA